HLISDAELDPDAPMAELADLSGGAIAHRVRLTREGGAPVARIISQAAGTDRRLAKLWRGVFAPRPPPLTGAPPGPSPPRQLQATLEIAEAADVLWGLTSNELYGILVLDRGWTPAHYERWLSHMLTASLIGEPGSDGAGAGTEPGIRAERA